MQHKTSQYTGNTRYLSEDGLFASMNPKAVETWEETKPKLEKASERHWWACKGQLFDAPAVEGQW